MWLLGLLSGTVVGAIFGKMIGAAWVGPCAVLGAIFGVAAGLIAGAAWRTSGSSLNDVRVHDLETKVLWLYEETQRLNAEIARLETRISAGVAAPQAAEAAVFVDETPTQPGYDFGADVPLASAEIERELETLPEIPPPVVRDAALTLAPLDRLEIALPEVKPEPQPEAATTIAEAAAVARSPKTVARPVDSEIGIPRQHQVLPPPPDEPSFLQTVLQRWVFGGNPLVKIGVLLLFLGFAFLLRYAAEHAVLPIEFRYAGVAASAIGLLLFGWRLRHKQDSYGLILQGAGVGVLYLTTLAAMRLHPLIPLGFGFAVLIGVAAFAALLAVLQDSLALAVIATLGGFAAPVLASSGSGDHVALFSYLALLNAGIVAIAWFKAWRPLNLIGFVGTFLLACAWAEKHYRPELFATTEPFLLLLFVLYVLITFLFARRSLAEADESDEEIRESVRKVSYVDGTLAFGVPITTFGLQCLLVRPFEYGAAFSALGFGLVYLVLAFALFYRNAARYRLLTETMIALGVIFASLAIPLGLEHGWTSVAWAVEAAGVYWIGIRQEKLHARLFAMLLLLGSAIYFSAGMHLAPQGPVLSGSVLGSVLLAAAIWWVCRLMRLAGEEVVSHVEMGFRPVFVALGAFFVALMPFMLWEMAWASPALAVLAALGVFIGLRAGERPLLFWCLIYQGLAGALFLATLHVVHDGPVLDGSLAGCAVLALSLWAAYGLIRLLEEADTFALFYRGCLLTLGALFIAIIPFLLWAMDWASPALAVLGGVAIFAALRLGERPLLYWGWFYQALAGALFIGTLQAAQGGSVLAHGWTGLLAVSLIGASMLAAFWAVTRQSADAEADETDQEAAFPAGALASAGLLAGLAFINLAPLFVLPMRMAAMVWPLTGILTLYWAVRVRHGGALLFALVLQAIAGFAHLNGRGFGLHGGNFTSDAGDAFLHSGFLGPLLIALAAFVCARLLQRKASAASDVALGWITLAWGVLWWGWTWASELDRVLPSDALAAALTGVAAASALLWSFIARRWQWPQLGLITLLYLPVLVAIAAVSWQGGNLHPLAGWGALAWPLALLMHALLLHRQENWLHDAWQELTHTVGAWLFVALAAIELRWQFAQWGATDSAWPLLGWMIAPVAYLWLLVSPRVQRCWPLREHYNAYVVASAIPLLLYLFAWLWIVNFRSNGAASPLPYLPLLNPLEIAQLAVLLGAAMWWRSLRENVALRASWPLAVGVLGLSAFAVLTGMVVRTCHHWGHVPWNEAVLLASNLVQTSLSVVWSIVAIGLMLAGNRSLQRWIWGVGAALLAVVVVKLFLVELSATGSLERIVSFIVVGLLVLVVGYFAPLPPKRAADADVAEEAST